MEVIWRQNNIRANLVLDRYVVYPNNLVGFQKFLAKGVKNGICIRRLEWNWLSRDRAKD